MSSTTNPEAAAEAVLAAIGPGLWEPTIEADRDTFVIVLIAAEAVIDCEDGSWWARCGGCDREKEWPAGTAAPRIAEWLCGHARHGDE